MAEQDKLVEEQENALKKEESAKKLKVIIFVMLSLIDHSSNIHLLFSQNYNSQ